MRHMPRFVEIEVGNDNDRSDPIIWELYHLALDRSETKDVASEYLNE